MSEEAPTRIYILKNAVEKDTACLPIKDVPVTHEYRVALLPSLDSLYSTWDELKAEWQANKPAVAELFKDSPVFCDVMDALGFCDQYTEEQGISEEYKDSDEDVTPAYSVISDFQKHTFAEISK